MMILRRSSLAGNLVLVVLALAAVLLAAESALVAASPGLFSPADAGPVPDGDPGRGVLRSRFVEVDFEQLVAAASPDAATGTLVLNFFDDVVLTALPERVVPKAGGGLTWSGRVQDVEMSQVTLVVRDGILAGNVALPGAFYQVRYAGGGVYAIREIDQSAFPPEREPIPVEGPGEVTGAAPVAPADDGSIVDVLVAYTSAAAGAPGDILADIDLAVEETNDTYANSGINQRLRLVHAAQVSYAQSGDFETDLARLKNPADGYMDGVHGLRDTYGADEVVLLVYYPSGDYCGIAYMMDPVGSYFASSAFAVVDVQCATGYYSFGHELGHNMGARHDWYVDTNATPYTHAHGYVNATRRWRTVMAYDTECYDGGFNCQRLPAWSNPDVLYGGDPLGVPEGTYPNCSPGQPNPHCDADNRKTLNKTAYTVANFRQSVLLPPVAPSNLTATPLSSTRIDLAWTDNSNNESGFRIERTLAGVGAWSQIAMVGVNVQGYADTGLVPDSGYEYRVRAYNAQGNSAYSNVAQATTLAEVGPVAFAAYEVDDDNLGGSAGNGDGRIDCGETIELYVDLRNLGAGLADNVQVSIGSSSPYVTWLDGYHYYGDIAGGQTARNADPFDFRLSPSTPHGHVLQFDLDVTAVNGGPWDSSFVTWVRCGGPVFTSYLPVALRNAAPGFDSQFNGSADGWQGHSGSWWIDSSAWYRTDGVAGAWASASYASTYRQLDYTARVWRRGCADCTHGLLVRGGPEPLGSQNTWDTGYGFYITRNGQYAIYDYAGGEGTLLQPWTFSSAINTGDAWNELRVVASGSKLSFYINGGLVWIGSSATHAAGRVGVAIYRDPSSPDNILWVDWAKLVPQAAAADPGELPAEQQALNEAAWQREDQGSDGRAPAR